MEGRLWQGADPANAAAIRTSVFAAFLTNDDATVTLFAVSLSSAVLLDAFIVRLILIPSLMTIFGTANWWLPGWLARVLPRIRVEFEEDIEAGSSEIEDIDVRGEQGARV